MTNWTIDVTLPTLQASLLQPPVCHVIKLPCEVIPDLPPSIGSAINWTNASYLQESLHPSMTVTCLLLHLMLNIYWFYNLYTSWFKHQQLRCHTQAPRHDALALHWPLYKGKAKLAHTDPSPSSQIQAASVHPSNSRSSLLKPLFPYLHRGLICSQALLQLTCKGNWRSSR